jgi:radical SAM family uncharacterized protein
MASTDPVPAANFEQQIQPRLLKVQKPARYIGAEPGAISKDWTGAGCRIVLAFPDIYEIGMSYHGREVLYQCLNARSDTLCERVFLPARDMEALILESGTPLWSLESKHPIADFDALGISLTHELAFPSALQLLQLAGLPLRSVERTRCHPLVIAGGHCMCNPEPMAPFFDVIVNGEGEEVLGELVDAFQRYRDAARMAMLEHIARIPGCYVPQLHKVDARSVAAEIVDAPCRIERRWLKDFAAEPIPVKPVQPYIQVPSDKAYIEVMRGCPQGCRFCQAGYITRPARARGVAQIAQAAAKLANVTGSDEVGLMSLSTLDHPEITELVAAVKKALPPGVGVALPSMRADAMSAQLAEIIRRPRETSLTIAIEGGSEALRNAINKRVSTEDIHNTFQHLMAAGWHKFKLYFMCGFAGEPLDAMDDIAQVVDDVFTIAKEQGKRKPRLRVSMSVLVPKAHTPLQWQAMERPEDTREKQRRLKALLKRHGHAVELHWHDVEQAVIEALLSRGGRELAPVIEDAMLAGQTLLSDYFDFDVWLELLERHGIDLEKQVYTERMRDQPLPWDHIDRGVEKDHLWMEWQAFQQGQPTPPCHEQCSACGLGCDAPLFG